MIRSLRLRLVGFAVLSGAAVLFAAWWSMGDIVEHNRAEQIARQIEDEARLVAAAVKNDNQGVHLLEERLAVPFSRGGSGSYWQAWGQGFVLRSSSLEGHDLSAPELPHYRWHEAAGPLDEEAVIQRTFRLPSAAGPLLVRVAHDEGVVDQQEVGIRRDMAHFMLVLGLALALAAALQVELGLLPLRVVRCQLDTMRQDPLKRLGGSHPNELIPLTKAIDALADAREKDVGRARRRAADLAHALKTPIAALSAESRRIRVDGGGRTADQIDRALALASATIETELARTRAATIRGGVVSDYVDPACQIERLFGVLSRTSEGEMLVFDCAVPEAWRLAIDCEAFAEIFGNLLGNATRHARRVVRVAAEERGGGVFFEVSDDGAGIAEHEYTAAFLRGRRLDQRRGGHGLGMAIVNDLVDATGGEIALGRAQLGGLSVKLFWPSLGVGRKRELA